jgi:DNA-binding response OmpR family regulator
MHLLLAEGASGAKPGFDLILSLPSQDYCFDYASSSEMISPLLPGKDILVLCQYLDDMSGQQALAQLRFVGISVPVIFLTNSADHADRAHMLRLGADDAVSLPVHKDELAARIFAVLQRPREVFLPRTSGSGSILLDLNWKAAFVVRGGHKIRIPLAPQEFDLLRLLVEQKEKVVTRDVILDELYGDKKEPEMKIIDVMISHIRKKLKSALNWDPIDTSWGRGYRLLEEPETGQIVDKVA